ncbi:putative importin subunit beta-4 [Exophiala dermatitidis]
MDQQKFLQQLAIVLDPKKGDVKAATNVLQNEFYKNPQSLLFLIQLVISHDSPDLKQLAATQARPLVSKHWTKIPNDQRQHARSQLFQATLSEPAPLVRHSASRLISSIAKIDLEDGEWAELPGMLQQAATSSRAAERAVGVYVLYSILETMGDGFSSKFKDLFALFSKTIKDPESLEVRVNTMLAISKMALVLDAEEDQASVRAFQDIFPSMVAVLKDTIDAGQDDQIMLTFEVFNTLLTAEYQLMSKHFQELVVFMNDIAANTNMSDEVRTQAISFLMQCVVYRRLRVQGAKMGEPLTKSMLQIVAEMDDDDDDEDDITPPRSALGLIDTMAQSLPASQVVVPLLDALPQYSKNPDPRFRRAGILALGMAVEGAPDFLSTQLSSVLPILFTLLEDPEVSVRRAALQTTARLADDMPEDVTKQHEKLMPLLVKNLTAAMGAYKGEEDGPAVDIMKSGASAIDAVVDGMDAQDAVQYLDKLAPLLQRLFKHPDFKIKALAAGALGSLASTVEAPFLPYLKDSMEAMQEYIMKKESEEELDLRASCTDAIGEMAVAVGAAEFKNYVQPLMQASEEALHLDHSRLKESTYILWGSLAKVYEDDFAPFLGGVVQGLFACIDQEEADLEVSLGDSAKDLLGKEVTIAGQKVKVAAADSDDEAEDGTIEDVDIDGDDDSDWGDLATVTPISLEKEIAIEVIGDLVSNTKTAYLPYFEKTIEKLLPLTEHSYENVRKATVGTLHRAYAALYDLSEESGQLQKWKPGLPLQVEPTPELKKFGEVLMSATLNVWTEEEDAATVTEISRSLSENLKMTGPSLLSYPDVLTKIVQTVGDLITKKHPCQIDMADEALDEEDMESTELEWLVVDSAMDVISGLAAALGPSFGELWKIFEKQVLRYASGGEALGRASACGVLAEVITGMEAAVTPYTSQMMNVLLKRLGDEDAQTKSNAAYAIGRLVEKSADDATILKAYPQILQKLESLFHIREARCTDNAAGCVARMIMKHKDKVPVAQVLPALVEGGILPLEDDYQENEPVWKMIVQLYRDQDPTVQQLTPKLAPIMMSVLGEPEDQLTDEVREQVQALVEHLKSIH